MEMCLLKKSFDILIFPVGVSVLIQIFWTSLNAIHAILF